MNRRQHPGGHLRGCVEVNDGEVMYMEAGEGAPVLLIHGLSGSWRWWARNVDALASHFRVLALDLTGFGGNRGASPFVLHRAATQLREWMDRLEIPRAHVVGHSMGGLIAAEFASDHPERLQRLVLVSAAALPLSYGYGVHARGLMGIVRTTPFDFLRLLAEDALRAGPATLYSATRQLLTADIRVKLGNIHAETLVVWGERDPLVPVAVGRELERLLPRVRLALIPGAGHIPMWERAREFDHLVVPFLLGTADGQTARGGLQSILDGV